MNLAACLTEMNQCLKVWSDFSVRKQPVALTQWNVSSEEGWDESSPWGCSIPKRDNPQEIQDAERRRKSKMLSKHALKHSKRVSLWYIPLILRAKTEQHWKLKELSRWIFWANESLAICVYRSCSQSWVTFLIKILFRETWKVQFGGTRMFCKYTQILQRVFQRNLKRIKKITSFSFFYLIPCLDSFWSEAAINFGGFFPSYIKKYPEIFNGWNYFNLGKREHFDLSGTIFLPHFQLKLSSSKTQNPNLFSFLIKMTFPLKIWKLLSGTLKYVVGRFNKKKKKFLGSFLFQVSVMQLPKNNFSAMSDVCGTGMCKTKPVNSSAWSEGCREENLSSFICSSLFEITQSCSITESSGLESKMCGFLSLYLDCWEAGMQRDFLNVAFLSRLWKGHGFCRGS